jgi:hypothetical protein
MKAVRWTVAACLALLLVGCASSSGGRGENLWAVLNDARAHPENRLADEVACERALDANTRDFAYRPFFAGLLAVPEAEGGRAFCTALIEAVIAGDFSQADQDTFKLPSELRGKAPLGTLLHAAMVAHERLHAQRAQQPPQAQSCGCGQ